MTTDILAVGEPLLEFNATVDGNLANSTSFSVGYGGDTSNFAVAAARSNARTGYLTRIGDDAFGTALTDLWRRESIDTTHVVREAGGQTGIYFIAREAGEHGFTYYRENSPASRMIPEDITGTAIGRTRLMHLTGITQAVSSSACDAAFHAMTLAREHGTTISYDPNHRPALWPSERARSIIQHSLELCDIALPNLEEGILLTGSDDPHEIIGALAERGPRIVVLKRGAHGVLVHDGESITEVPAHPVTPIDASGAGDTFDGAFTARLLEGVSPAEAARYAVTAAAITTTGHGTVNPIPHRAEILRAL